MNQRQALREPQPPEPNFPKLRVESLQGVSQQDRVRLAAQEKMADQVVRTHYGSRTPSHFLRYKCRQILKQIAEDERNGRTSLQDANPELVTRLDLALQEDWHRYLSGMFLKVNPDFFLMKKECEAYFAHLEESKNAGRTTLEPYSKGLRISYQATINMNRRELLDLGWQFNARHLFDSRKMAKEQVIDVILNDLTDGIPMMHREVVPGVKVPELENGMRLDALVTEYRSLYTVQTLLDHWTELYLELEEEEKQLQKQFGDKFNQQPEYAKWFDRFSAQREIIWRGIFAVQEGVARRMNQVSVDALNNGFYNMPPLIVSEKRALLQYMQSFEVHQRKDAVTSAMRTALLEKLEAVPDGPVGEQDTARAKQFFEQLYGEIAPYQQLIRLLSVPQLPAIVKNALDPDKEGFEDLPKLSTSEKRALRHYITTREISEPADPVLVVLRSVLLEELQAIPGSRFSAQDTAQAELFFNLILTKVTSQRQPFVSQNEAAPSKDPAMNFLNPMQRILVYHIGSRYSNRLHAKNILEVVRSVEKQYQEALPRHELSMDFWRIEHDLEPRQQRFGRIRY